MVRSHGIRQSNNFGFKQGALGGSHRQRALPVLFLLMDGVMKLFKPAVVVDATFKVGYAESTIVPLGIALLACTILYVVPQTSVLGAILLTGYLGGAVATHGWAIRCSAMSCFPRTWARSSG